MASTVRPTPALMPTVRTAQAPKAARTPDRGNVRVAHTTSTGDKPRTAPVTGQDSDFFDEPYCFVCSRVTDHFAEHDDAVEAGAAYYHPDGSVYTAFLWNDWVNRANLNIAPVTPNTMSLR